MKKKPAVEIDFAELSDGSLAEMIENPADGTKTLLAVYRNGSVQYSERVEDEGKILVPLLRADQDLKHVRLAQGTAAYGQIGDLMRIIAGFFNALPRCRARVVRVDDRLRDEHVVSRTAISRTLSCTRGSPRFRKDHGHANSWPALLPRPANGGYQLVGVLRYLTSHPANHFTR